MMKFRQFNQYMADHNKEVFPSLPSGMVLPHIKTDGTIEYVTPVWYDYILSGYGVSNFINNIASKKYGSLLIDSENYETTPGRAIYNSDYLYGFLPSINETMYRLYDLFTEKINPYHNVDEDTTITNVYGQTKQTTDIGERVTKNDIDDTKTTSKDGKYGNDSSTLKNTDQSELTTDARLDTYTTEDTQDVVTNDTHTDTLHTIRGGNIGVTTNKTLAFEHLEYANMMKLFDMFLNQYFKYFGVGMWGD